MKIAWHAISFEEMGGTAIPLAPECGKTDCKMIKFKDFRSRILEKVLRTRSLEGSEGENGLKLEQEHCSEPKSD